MIHARYRREFLEQSTKETFADFITLASVVSAEASFRIQFLDYAWAWVKSADGSFEPELETECTFADMLEFCKSQTLIVPDVDLNKEAAKLSCFKLGTEFKFWSVLPVFNSKKAVIALLHVFGPKPRHLTTEQITGLETIANLIGYRIELHAKAHYERLTAEENYEKQNEFLNAVLENLTDGIIACDDQGRLSVFNRATKELHGLDSRKDISPDKWAEHFSLFHPDGETILQEKDIPLIRAFNGEAVKDVEFVLRSTNGEYRSILSSGRALYNSAGEKLGAVLTLHDMTAEKEAQSKLNATMHSLKALVENCPIGIVSMNAEHEFTIWNAGTEKIFGWKKEESMLRFQNSSDPHIAEFKSLFTEVSTKLQRIERDMTVRRKDGKMVDIHVTLLPLFDENNDYNGFLCVSVDISDIKQREMNLLNSNTALQAASAAKSQFLATMSHEIRTPLNGIIGMTEIMLLSSTSEEQRHNLQIVHSSASSLLTILSDILDFSKIEAGKIEVEKVSFDIRSLVDELHESLNYSANEKGLLLKKEFLFENQNKLIGDPVKIRQVLLNLLTNSLKFTESGEVKTSVTVLNTPRNTSTLLIKVKDTGLGIDEAQSERLFKAFTQADSSTTRKFGGTGLGLSICKGLVEHMGGTMSFKSEKGVGSTFWFSLELGTAVDIAPADTTDVEPTVQLPQKQLRILIAEDNLVNQKIALAMLKKLGHHADVVEDGKAAVEALKSNSYDLILMDCQMPEMDGYEATRVIRKEIGLPNSIPIVALTANAMNGDREKCLEAGMTDYMSKPLQVKTLTETLARVISPGLTLHTLS